MPERLPEWIFWTLPPEVPFPGGLLVAAPLVVGALAAIVSLPLLWMMDRARLGRFVWHPPLFTLGFVGLIYAFLGLWLLPR